MSKEIILREKDVTTFLDKVKPDIERNRRRDYAVQDFITSVVAAVRESDGLRAALATQEGKGSMRNALCKAAVTGLSVNPLDGKAALIPYKNKVSYQIMKDGIIDLAMETGRVDVVKADIVREHDSWMIRQTTDGDIYEHMPARRDRGEVNGYYAACRMTDGKSHVKYMTIEEVRDHAIRYATSGDIKALLTNRVHPDSIADDLLAIMNDKKVEYGLRNANWIKSFDGMGKKTALKALFGDTYITPEIRSLVMSETSGDEIVDADFKEDTGPGASAADVRDEMESKAEEAPAEASAPPEPSAPPESGAQEDFFAEK